MTTAEATRGVSQAEFARRQGWAKSYVTKLKLAGRLVMLEDGSVDEEASLRQIQATAEVPERASSPAVSPSTRSDIDRKTFYEAEKSRLDLEERIGKLLDADQTLSALADAAVRLRTALETWPERLSSPLAALGGDEARIRAYLAEHIETALEEIARGFAKAAGKSE